MLHLLHQPSQLSPSASAAAVLPAQPTDWQQCAASCCNISCFFPVTHSSITHCCLVVNALTLELPVVHTWPGDSQPACSNEGGSTAAEQQ
jgi:hypothetical protein